MPTVVNGIGTWYYGKRRIHTRKGTCEFCGSLAELTSYDTTLFFVVVFVPLIPLARKRILEQCAICQKHRVLALDKWEEAKAKDGAIVLDKLETSPNDLSTLANALAFVRVYQDEPLFNQVIEPLALERREDAGIQAELGDTYAYFARWPNAEAAYRASLAVADNEPVREGLAWTLLKQGRPTDAWPFLKHIIDNRKQEGAWLIYFLVKAYQAEGLHDEALARMDERDEAFPELVQLKDYQKQRKTSMRYRGSAKRVGSSFLDERGRTGYRQGNWTARLPRWIAASLLVGALAAYLGSAVWIGQARKVYLVNGTNQQYTISVGGKEFTLPPRAPIQTRVAEGELEVVFKDAKLGLKPVRCTIESSFWSRPFASRTFIINPDQSAVVMEAQAVYTAGNVPAPPNPQPQFHIGRPSYSFSGMDYEFEEFPLTLQMRAGQTLTKTRVALAPPLDADSLCNFMLDRLQGQEMIDVAKGVLSLDPRATVFLHRVLYPRLSPQQLLDFLQVHLDDRPPLVEWHRLYQSVSERFHPDQDLRPRYQELLDQSGGHRDAVYLLARVQPDWAQAEKLYRQAAAANPPSGFAMYGLGYRALSSGEFGEAVRWFEKAVPLINDKTITDGPYHAALLANRDFDRLLKTLQAEANVPGKKFPALVELAKLHAVRGDKQGSRSAMARAVEGFPPQIHDKFQKLLENLACCWDKDVACFLKTASGDSGPPFEVAFLRGDLKQASKLAAEAKHIPVVAHALVYLAATKSKAKELADLHWQPLLTALRKAGRDERLLADILDGKKSLDVYPARHLVIEPKDKRVLLVVLAQRYPQQAAELLQLARKLDFERDPVSLCLLKVLPD